MSKETKKLYGRKSGWCSSPSKNNPKASHDKCDGIWWETKEGEILHCPCECHDITALKLANAEKKKKMKAEKETPCKEHPKYQGIRKPRTGCDNCWSIYLANNPTKHREATAS